MLTDKTRDAMVHWSIYVRGIPFPQDKAGLIAQARRNNAPESFLRGLRSLPERTYHTAADVGREINKIQVRSR